MAAAMAGEEEVPTAPWPVWVGLMLVAGISFWCQAAVTEERFVPALNVISNIFHIPDDVAGATLMAAGASSPELLSSFISLFVTHSSLGFGTIVGSEVFNQLIICAGAVFASKTGSLALDPAILLRETGFYALAIGLLYSAMRNAKPDPDDPTSGEDHIFITFWDASYVFGAYILYIILCANMDTLVTLVTLVKNSCRRRTAVLLTTNPPPTTYGSVASEEVSSSGPAAKRVHLPGLDDNIPFLQEKTLTQEPAGNFQVVEYERTTTGERSEPAHHDGTRRRSSFLAQSLKQAVGGPGTFSDGAAMRTFQFLLHTEKPSDDRDLYNVEVNTFEDRLSCFMWQRSYFYNKARFATHGWHLRWFTLTLDRMFSVPDRTNFERHKVTYPTFKEIEVDDVRLIIRVVNPDPQQSSVYLLCPSCSILEQVVSKMEEMIDHHEKRMVGATGPREDSTQPGEFEDGEAEVSLVEFPVTGSNTEIIFFVLLFPFRFLMHWTIPDVRNSDHHGIPISSTAKAFLATFSCLVWLIVGSYAMVSSLEALAALMDIPDAVVGVTVSAAGTSLPNYVASKIAAEKGFGNMAVSNAFGSNTFNIMVGLGLPWFVYTSFGTGFKPYHDLLNEGITEGVVILAIVLLVFVVIVFPSGFVIHRWHGALFLVMYFSFLLYSIIPAFMRN